MTSAQLVVDRAVVGVGGETLLGPVNLRSLTAGLTMVMGANGAGKSLFLRLVHGLIRPVSGTVTWAGSPAHGTMQSRGFMFQAAPVMRRSVAGNVAYPLQAAGLPKDQVQQRVASMLHEARLADKAQMPAAQLSGGERQRMALARALVTEPDVLLMDEPSAALDPASTRALEVLIAEVVASGTPVLMSTHDIGQARRLAEEILFFDRGQLAEAGPAGPFFAGPATAVARDYLEGRL